MTLPAATELIDSGRAIGGLTEPHRLTVFAAFHVGEVPDIVRNPAAPVGWEAVSADVHEVAASITTLYAAGAHGVVLVPLATDPISALNTARESLVPKVREVLASI